MKRLLATTLSLTLTAICLYAEKTDGGKAPSDSVWISSPILTLEPGKKIMYVADLDIADNVTLGELLQMFPELTTRDDEDLLKNFDLQVEDISSGSSKEILLTQYKAAEIKKIELSVNPSASSQINGQGGVINVFLNTPEENFHGAVTLEASTTWDVDPAFKFSYAKDKLKLKGMVSGEYYQPRDYNTSITTVNSQTGKRIYQDEKDDYKYGIQFADLQMEYAFNDKHRLKAWVWENYTRENHNINCDTDSCGVIYKDQVWKNQGEFSVYTGLNYKYTAEHAVFETELSYKYQPGANNRYKNRSEKAVEDFSDYDRQHALNGKIKGTYKLFGTAPYRKCDFVLGLNASFSPRFYNFTDVLNPAPSNEKKESLAINTNDLYVSPFVEVDTKFGPVFLKGGVRYQFFQYNIVNSSQREFTKPNNKVTAFLNFGWQIAPHHHLSLILDKSLKRPDNQQIYPFSFFDPDKGTTLRGNPDLRSEDIYTASIDYQYDFSRDGMTILAGCGIRYNHIDAVIAQIQDKKINFDNRGHCDVINTTAMGVYSYGPFKVFLTGKLLQNWYEVPQNSNSNFSYNIAVTPMLSFKDDWRISAVLEYNSNVITLYKNLGRYFYSEVRLSKGIKDWTVYIELTDNFHRVVTDVEYVTADITTTTLHYLHFPGLVLGASWNF